MSEKLEKLSPAGPKFALAGLRFSRGNLSEYGIILSFLVLTVLVSVSSDVFLTPRNALNIFDQWAPVGIIALGQTLVIIAGGFDLSVAAIFAVGGVIAAQTTNTTGSVLLGWLSGAIAGALLGSINGGLVTFGRINPLIATLATSLAFGGLALVLTGGTLITVEDQAFRSLGRDAFLGIKWTIWMFALAIILAGIALSRSNFGRYIFATGGNSEAARLSGIRTAQISATTYIISGLCAGLAGVMVASRIGTGQADAGSSFALTSIAAVVLGGTSIKGGYGAIWRTVLGVLMLAVIGNGFNLLGVNPVYQQMVMGAVIALAVSVDAWARKPD